MKPSKSSGYSHTPHCKTSFVLPKLFHMKSPAQTKHVACFQKFIQIVSRGVRGLLFSNKTVLKLHGASAEMIEVGPAIWGMYSMHLTYYLLITVCYKGTDHNPVLKAVLLD